MIDSHCHLDFDDFTDDISEVLERARNQGVTRFLIPGTTPSGWQRQCQLHGQHDDIDIAFGLHPYFLQQDNEQALGSLEQQLAHAADQAVAVGEIGLDATVDVPEKEQIAVLDRQLSLAKEARLPVILHHRKTHHLLLARLKATGFDQGGVIHAFSGSKEVADAYRDHGFLLGIGGTVTYSRAKKTRATVAAMPVSALLLETDSPDMPVCGYQGKRNEPVRVTDVAAELAAIRDCAVNEIDAATTNNYQRLFSSN
ncbi:TatD family hydrolase [Alteromonas sp. ASW11-19]|uniref:TatD family hydrolase n=1 Tax=Alteromonas salexigens TaxID=2982530 RepID=A0ABT2VV69_9ALTE|nr:TatD family hydrolase [Alteromonas salexigens]MCU7555749.1 TatD family hydrolase [Alteromonas salexigens]